ncbi:F-box protein, partial [Streptomyces sp. NPDC057910]|uniref:F-box protein n=1 Tax=Streptomyces sp. NPDC057910 TaxID=3346278 RepID=UPI0036E435E5
LMTTEDVAGAELNDQAQDVWAIVAPALQDSDSEPDLPARTYQALQTWPAHNLPHDLWQDILTLLPLEDQTRLAHTSHHVQDIVEQLAPQALDPTAHTTPDFTRTIYTQTELNTSLSENPGQWVKFIPGTDSNLTIGHGKAEVHGPGTLTAITGGRVTALDDTHITTVTGGSVAACDQATIATVTGGTIRAFDQASIEKVTGGNIEAREQATVTAVTGGTVLAYDQATITTVTGGDVDAGDDATITTLTGGTVYADDQVTIGTMSGGNATAEGQTTITSATGGTITATGNATVTAVGGDAHIVALGNAHVIIQAGADGVCVDAYDTAHITAHSGTITLHSPDVTVTSNSDSGAVISHA